MMSKPYNPPAIKYFLGNHTLAQIFDKTIELRQLDQVLRLCLEPSLQPYCQIANWHEAELVILVANNAIATRLRYHQLELAKNLRAHPEFKQLSKIRIKVQQRQSDQRKNFSKQPKLISAGSRSLLKETAKHLTHPELKDAVNKLAENGFD